MSSSIFFILSLLINILEASDFHKHSKYFSFLLKNLAISNIIGLLETSSEDSRKISQYLTTDIKAG